MESTTPSHTTSSANSAFPVGNPGGGEGFVERRSPDSNSVPRERRQFGSSHATLSEPGRELAMAIDAYKVKHHRRYITCDEMLSVLTKLGYQKVR